MPTRTLTPGSTISARYEVGQLLGRGGMASVYRAHDSNLNLEVALKVLPPYLAVDPTFVNRFRREGQTLAKLTHPNILRLYEIGEDSERDLYYLVLEYLGGGSLRDMLDRGHRLTPAQALLVGSEAARGLDHAHRRGLVHRDIKPANLLFDEEGRVCVADFGVARALAEAAWTEPTGTVIGTARYASPEQARGRSPRHRRPGTGRPADPTRGRPSTARAGTARAVRRPARNPPAIPRSSPAPAGRPRAGASERGRRGPAAQSSGSAAEAD